MVVLEQYGYDRVEGQSRGVGADLFQDGLRAVLLHGEDRRRHFRHRLYTEAVTRISDLDALAVGHAYRYAEERGRNILKIGYVGGVLPLRSLGILRVCLVYGRNDGRLVYFMYHDLTFFGVVVLFALCGRRRSSRGRRLRSR